VRRTFFTFAALAMLAALLVPTALAARVAIRVEGRTQTIFGAAEPRVDAADALEALELASLLGEFYYHVAQSAFGRYVDQIGRYPAAGTSGWVFKVNGEAPPVGADAVQWYHATFGSGGGPPTLLLRRTARNCYRVVAENDQGVDTAAAGAVLHVDGRRVQTRGGRACVGRHRGLVRATRAGAVRSNALR
jgi:hypothetical protein